MGIRTHILLLLTTLLFSQTAQSLDCMQALSNFKDALTVKFLETRQSNHPAVNIVHDVMGADAPSVLLEARRLGERNLYLSILEVAVNLGYVDLIKALFEFSNTTVADASSVLPEAQNSDNSKLYSSALEVAVHFGYVDLVKELFKLSNATVNVTYAPDRSATFLLAAKHGHVDVIKEFVVADDMGVIINATDYRGNTALMLVAERGHVDAMNILLEASPDINLNAINSDGYTALMLATENEHVDAVKMLLPLLDMLEAFDISEKNYFGDSPISH